MEQWGSLNRHAISATPWQGKGTVTHCSLKTHCACPSPLAVGECRLLGRGQKSGGSQAGGHIHRAEDGQGRDMQCARRSTADR